MNKSETKNYVSTLGTLHDNFLINPKYGLKEFISALYQFNPDIILSEVRVEYPTAEDAAIDGGIEQAIIYAYAQERSIPVVATDWFDENFIREIEEEGKKVAPELIEKLKPMTAYQESFNTASLLELNSESIKSRVRAIYKTLDDNNLLCSRKRNDRIIENIYKELNKFNNKKVLIIYGMDHKFFIDDHLNGQSNVELLEVSSWFNSEISESFKITDSIKLGSLKNLEKSASLLNERLNSKFYSAELEARLKVKQSKFANWINSVSRLI